MSRKLDEELKLNTLEKLNMNIDILNKKYIYQIYKWLKEFIEEDINEKEINLKDMLEEIIYNQEMQNKKIEELEKLIKNQKEPR